MRSSARLAALAAIGLAISCAGAAAQLYPNTSNFGVPFSEAEHWYQQCMRVADVGEPEMSGARDAASRCNASELYYTKRNQATASPEEWSKVRACAVANADNAVLMMLYANGFGVQRNTDVALHYACKLDFIAKSEMELRIAHLVSAKQTEAPFDQCDDITSGYMQGVCATYARQDAALNDAYQAVMTAPSGQDGWPDRIGTSTVDHASVRNTERRWLDYRDAFVAFAAKLPSPPDLVAVKTLLTNQRIAQLKNVERYR